MSDINKNIGAAIKKCRVQRDMGQDELAQAAGLSVSYLSLIERGKRTPNLEVVESIAEGLNIPLNILIFLATDKSDLEDVDKGIAEKLSLIAWKLLEAKDEPTPLPQ